MLTLEAVKQMPSFPSVGLLSTLHLQPAGRNRMTWQEEERRKPCSGMQSLLCYQLTGRHLRSRHSSLAHPSKEVTHMHLPPCTASQGWRVWGQPHIPQLLQPPRRLGRGWLPLNVPSQALYWLTGWANTRQGWKQEPGAGWVCTNNKAEGINQLWLLASLQGTFH